MNDEWKELLESICGVTQGMNEEWVWEYPLWNDVYFDDEEIVLASPQGFLESMNTLKEIHKNSVFEYSQGFLESMNTLKEIHKNSGIYKEVFNDRTTALTEAFFQSSVFYFLEDFSYGSLGDVIDNGSLGAFSFLFREKEQNEEAGSRSILEVPIEYHLNERVLMESGDVFSTEDVHWIEDNGIMNMERQLQAQEEVYDREMSVHNETQYEVNHQRSSSYTIHHHYGSSLLNGEG